MEKRIGAKNSKVKWEVTPPPPPPPPKRGGNWPKYLKHTQWRFSLKQETQKANWWCWLQWRTTTPLTQTPSWLIATSQVHPMAPDDLWPRSLEISVHNRTRESLITAHNPPQETTSLTEHFSLTPYIFFSSLFRTQSDLVTTNNYVSRLHFLTAVISCFSFLAKRVADMRLLTPSFSLLWKIRPSPSQRHPQSSSFKQFKQIVHRLVKATERGGEGLIFHRTPPWNLCHFPFYKMNQNTEKEEDLGSIIISVDMNLDCI